MACTGSGVQIPSAPQTNMNLKYIKEIFSQTKDLIGSQSGIAIISIIQVSFVVNQLGPEKYGAVVLLIAIPSLIFRATHARNVDANLLILKKDNNLFFESLLFNFITGLVAGLICIFVFTNPLLINSSIGEYFGLEVLSLTLLFYIFSRIIQTFSETTKSLLIFHNDMKRYSLLEIGSVFVRFTAIVILLLNDPTIENFLIAQSIYGFIFGLSGIYLVKTHLKNSKNKINIKNYIKKFLSPYKKIRYDQIIRLIPQHFDVILLAIIIDLEAVGIYQFAKRLVEPINFLIVTFNPWLQNKLKTEDKSFLLSKFFVQIILPITSILIFIYLVFGKNLILLLGNENFINSYEPMLILLIGFLTYFLTFWIRQYLLFNDLIEFHAYGRIIYSITFIVLALVLSNSFSATGIATSLAIAMVSQKLFELIVYRKKIR